MPVQTYIPCHREVQAIQWTGDNGDEIREFVGVHASQPGFRTKPKKNKAQVFNTGSKEWEDLPIGDYVLKDHEGYFAGVEKDVFENLYMPKDVPLISDSVPADHPFREGAEGR